MVMSLVCRDMGASSNLLQSAAFLINFQAAKSAAQVRVRAHSTAVLSLSAQPAEDLNNAYVVSSSEGILCMSNAHLRWVTKPHTVAAHALYPEDDGCFWAN